MCILSSDHFPLHTAVCKYSFQAWMIVLYLGIDPVWQASSSEESYANYARCYITPVPRR